MAEKKTPMGDDPLAWLAEGDDGGEDSPPPAKKTRTRRTNTRRQVAKVKTETELLEESFAALAPQGAELAKQFYERLFDDYPQLTPLFEGISVKGQEKKLLASLVLLVQNLHKPEVLKDYLMGLGARHVHYGVTKEHYPMVAETLLTVMEEFAGELWTDEVAQAWANILNTVATIMLETYESTETDEMAITKQAVEQELAVMRAAVDGSSTALMMCDKDLVITYANPAVMSLLTNRIAELRKVFPALDLNKVVGTCIDDFHKDPSLQRGILADIRNLPYNNQIQLLNIHFDLTATAILDADGNYNGNMVEWKDITDRVASEAEAVKKAEEVTRLQSAIDGATSALMMCDENRVITYANPAVMSMLSNRLADLRKLFPGLDLSKIIGTCIDDFHKDPSLQAGILGDVNRLPYRNQIQVLDLHFDLNATAIVNNAGEMIGNMVEWKDITDQKTAEDDVERVIGAAVQGQLDERINIDNTAGFTKTISEGVNSIMFEFERAVGECLRLAQNLEKGNLTVEVEGEWSGQVNDLAEALSGTITALSTTMGDINESAANVGTAASEISEGNIDLSQRTEQQASSLEETASSMEELTSTVRQNSDNARQANQLAASSREQAEKGGSVIKEAISAMTAISASSKKVTDIIGVIDEIAFQTNLLALNAAVEAARAGEQGRGFAVVASEVRNLAQRSASAAKEIKELINDSGEKVKEGSMLVDESGRTLEEIVASSKKVGDIISEIAAAGAEQTQGIEQVNKAVTQMDEMTQQNAALVEEAAAASESLDEQAKSMQRLMSFFEMGDESSAPVAEAPRPTPVAKAPAKKAEKVKARPKPAPQASSDDAEWDEF